MRAIMFSVCFTAVSLSAVGAQALVPDGCQNTDHGCLSDDKYTVFATHTFLNPRERIPSMFFRHLADADYESADPPPTNTTTPFTEDEMDYEDGDPEAIPTGGEIPDMESMVFMITCAGFPSVRPARLLQATVYSSTLPGQHKARVTFFSVLSVACNIYEMGDNMQ